MKKYSVSIHSLFVILMMLTMLSCKAQNDSRSTPTFTGENNITPFINPDLENQIAEYIRNIFQDKEGNLWMGTNGYGVAVYDGKKLKYFNESDGLSGSQVTHVMQANDDKIWITTHGGISVYDGESFKNYTTADGLHNEWVWSVYEDSNGQIWAGNVEGLSKLVNNKFVPIEIPSNSSDYIDDRFTAQWVRHITEIDGELWISTGGLGVCIYDGKKFRYLNEENGLCNNDVSCTMQDSKSNIWVATRFGGVCMYDGISFQHFELPNGIGNYESIKVYEDSAGNVWFSAEGYGLYRLNGKTLQNYSVDQGLKVKAVQAIYEDEEGRFWTGGGGGLYRLYGDTFVNVTKDGPWKK